MTYDTLNPVERLRDFTKWCKDVINRYEGNEQEAAYQEQVSLDLLHAIELEPKGNCPTGYARYAALREARITRRACKNENRPLKPLYDYLPKTNPQLLNQLPYVQGLCTQQAEMIERMQYTPRTQILKEGGS
mgnify:FL=1